MSDTVIKIEDLSKYYRLGLIGRGTLRDDVHRWWARLTGKPDPLLKIGQADMASRGSEYIWALREINLDVRRGDILGIIGLNGAGKSTLLKIISRITTPTSGSVKMRGRTASLLEIGTGFHPELTGRENVYLNGAILGMSKSEVGRKFDEIVAFSGVERFIDTPVKRYSSGMQVRLGFSVAAHLEPDILVVDEVLAVGDLEFQKQCIGKMGSVAREGRTVLFVSHNMGSIQDLCTSAIRMEHGSIVDHGDTDVVVGNYIESANDTQLSIRVSQSDRVTITKVVLKNGQGEPNTILRYGDDLEIEIHYVTKGKVAAPYFWIDITGRSGGLFCANMMFDELRPPYIEGRGTISCRFLKVRLLPGVYTVHMGAKDHTENIHIVPPSVVSSFRVSGDADELGMPGRFANKYFAKVGPVGIPYEWRYSDGSVASPDWLK